MAIVDELAVPESLQKWYRTGNLIVPGMFRWLWEGMTVDGQHKAGVGGMIDEEFDVYLYH